jgi:hypothetical protein
MHTRKVLTLWTILLALGACERQKPAPPPAAAVPEAPAATPTAPVAPASNPLRDVYFGAVHVHTGYSFDAFTNGSVSRPADAYAWAKGKPIQGNKAGFQLKIVTPLDFYAVSDHAEMMGVFPRMADPNSPISKVPIAARVTSNQIYELVRYVEQSNPQVLHQVIAVLARDASTVAAVGASVAVILMRHASNRTPLRTPSCAAPIAVISTLRPRRRTPVHCEAAISGA